MAYGQKNYLQIQGINGRYRIDQIGCFVTSFCNLIERLKGQEIDPPTLNAIFRDRGIYVDVDDGIRDDLGWQSVTAFDGSIVVTATGTGWPPTDNAIVKFIYRSQRTGEINTHFCLVADHNGGTIIDSWDGITKTSPYGTPVAWAAYADNTPQSVTPPPAPAVDVSGKELFLPSGAGLWRVYNLGGPWTPGHEVGKLSPVSYPPGLTYPIQGTIAHNIYKIHTEAFGDVAIYAGSDTIAQFVDPPTPSSPPPPAPEPAPAPEPTPTPPVNTITVTGPEPETEAPAAVPAPPLTIVDNSGAPEPTDWKLSYKINDAGKYMAIKNGVIRDLDSSGPVQPDLTIVAGVQVNVAGSFEKDGQKYYRTAKSVNNDWWYGLPVELLKPVSESQDHVGDELFGLDMKLEAEQLLKNLTVREKLVAIVAKLQGSVIRFFRTLTFKTKK